MKIECEDFEALVAAAADCIRRSRIGEAMVEQAEADLATLDARIVAAGYDPVAIVNRAYARA